MPHRDAVDGAEILRVYEETGSGKETARRLGVHPMTVYQKLRAVTLRCRSCSNTIEKGEVYCSDCREHHAARKRERRAARKEAAICAECDEPVRYPSRLYCAKHRAQHVAAVATQNNKRRYDDPYLPTSEEKARDLLKRFGPHAARVWAAQNGRCAFCSTPYGNPGTQHGPNSLHSHHSDGNHKNNAEENLTVLCQTCHMTVQWLLSVEDLPHVLNCVRKLYPHLPI